MTLQTVALKPETSMIEVMRRFRREPEATVLRAKHSRGVDGGAPHWRVQFIGAMPDLADLLQEGAA